MSKTAQITINDKPISVVQGFDKSNYISLTDMIIGNWLRLKDTIYYLGIWEKLNNPCFNPIEFDGIKTSAGTNRFILTAKEWIQKTGAIGIQSHAGRYGGTGVYPEFVEGEKEARSN